MAAKDIRDKVLNYNVYKNGTVYIGAATVDLPEISSIADAVKGAGFSGEIEIPALGQISSMTVTLNFNAIEPGANALMEPKFHMIDFRFGQQRFSAASETLGVEAIKITVKAMPKTTNRGSLEAGTAMGGSIEMEVIYYKEVIDGKVNIEIDKLNNIYIVNGFDYLKELRTALGE